jgi:hypothetical protein
LNEIGWEIYGGGHVRRLDSLKNGFHPCFVSFSKFTQKLAGKFAPTADSKASQKV